MGIVCFIFITSTYYLFSRCKFEAIIRGKQVHISSFLPQGEIVTKKMIHLQYELRTTLY